MNLCKEKKQCPSQKKKGFPRISLSQKLTRKLKLKKVTKKYRLVCENCDQRFLNWWTLRKHWESTGHKEPETCRWCKKRTYTLQSHLCREHWNLASICKYCGQLFMFRENRQKHELLHDKTVYRCYFCGHRKRSEELLRNHIYNHFMEEKYGCNICEKRFKKKKNIEKHLKEIHFICQYCGSTCDSKSDFKRHVEIHKDLKCILCQKVFTQMNRLKYHYQLQHGHQDFYKCPICFQRFVVKWRLLDHMKLKHKGDANYKCQICASPFLYWQHYKNHFESVHAKPLKSSVNFECTFCDFQTNLKCKLQWHVEKTSGLGFFCKKCQLPLECKGMFDKHMQTHVGECVWTCDYCTRSFGSDDILNHHMSMAHKKVMIFQNPRAYPCLEPTCNSYYTVKSSLARHVRKMHSDNVVSSTTHGGEIPVVSSLVGRKRTFHKSKMNKKKKLGEKESECSAEGTSGKGYHHMINLEDKTEVDVYHCSICEKVWLKGKEQFSKHMQTHSKNIREEECDDCDNIVLDSPEDAMRHFVEVHLNVEFEL